MVPRKLVTWAGDSPRGGSTTMWSRTTRERAAKSAASTPSSTCSLTSCAERSRSSSTSASGKVKLFFWTFSWEGADGREAGGWGVGRKGGGWGDGKA